MGNVREAAFDLFREQGMTTMFGNPGSTELPMLADFPSDFRPEAWAKPSAMPTTTASWRPST